jgi:hypothetical protein
MLGPWGSPDTGFLKSGQPFPTPPQLPQPQQQRGGIFGGADEDDGFRSMLGKLGPVLMMLDPQSASAGSALLQLQGQRGEQRREQRAQNQTAQWLQSTGMGAGEASFLASNPAALNSWYSAWKAGDKPDWHIEEIYDAQGRKQKVMLDYKTGKYNTIGGSGAPNLKIESIFDDKTGQERKILMNADTGEIIKELGGVKSDLLSPEEEAQKIRIGEATRPSTTVNVETKAQTKGAETLSEGYAKDQLELQRAGSRAPSTLGSIQVMRAAVNDPDFVSGGGADFLLRAKQWAKTLGYDPAGLTSTETFSALSKQAALDAMGGSLGTGFSEGDRQFVVGQVAGTGYSRGGNLALLAIQEKAQRRIMQIAKLARSYAKQHDGQLDLGWYEEVANWAERNPAFSPQEIKDITRMAQTPDPPGTGGGTGRVGTEPGSDWVDSGMVGSDGRPIMVRRGSTPPAQVAPVTPPPPQIEPAPAPEIVPPVTQPRVRSIAPQPNPLRFGY